MHRRHPGPGRSPDRPWPAGREVGRFGEQGGFGKAETGLGQRGAGGGFCGCGRHCQQFGERRLKLGINRAACLQIESGKFAGADGVGLERLGEFGELVSDRLQQLGGVAIAPLFDRASCAAQQGLRQRRQTLGQAFGGVEIAVALGFGKAGKIGKAGHAKRGQVNVERRRQVVEGAINTLEQFGIGGFAARQALLKGCQIIDQIGKQRLGVKLGHHGQGGVNGGSQCLGVLRLAIGRAGLSVTEQQIGQFAERGVQRGFDLRLGLGIGQGTIQQRGKIPQCASVGLFRLGVECPGGRGAAGGFGGYGQMSCHVWGSQKGDWSEQSNASALPVCAAEENHSAAMA